MIVDIDMWCQVERERFTGECIYFTFIIIYTTPSSEMSKFDLSVIFE